MVATLARQLCDDFIARYHQLHTPEPYRFDARAMAQRSLKNLCLTYVLETGSDAARQLCFSQLEQSANMTDTLAALAALAQYDWPERRTWLDRFYQQWQADAQVVDKWFSIQAGSRLPDTLEQVRTLMGHPAFKLTNPNKVRALIGRFCQGNPVRFHDASGAAYRFLGDRILQLDGINPQIAARLVSSLSRWRRYDEPRRALMKAELERIQETPDLSRDVFEIVDKSLSDS